MGEKASVIPAGSCTRSAGVWLMPGGASMDVAVPIQPFYAGPALSDVFAGVCVLALGVYGSACHSLGSFGYLVLLESAEGGFGYDRERFLIF